MAESGILEVEYQELFSWLSEKNIEEEARELLKQGDFFNKNNWLKGLVLCDLALINNTLTETIKKLYLQLYKKHRNLYFSSGLEEKEYKFWFTKTEEINDKFINQKFTRAYAERNFMLETARRPYRNKEKEQEFLLTGIELGDAACMAIYGYNLCFSMTDEKEKKEEGLKWMQKSRELGCEGVENYYLSVLYYTEIDTARILAAVEEFNNSRKDESEKAYHLLADFYLYKEKNLEKAEEALLTGIKHHNFYCIYILGISIVNNIFLGYEETDGIKFLEEAYKYGVIQAAAYLGQYYCYAPGENRSIEKSISWHEKAKLYYFEDSLVELALIYLREESVRDPEKGKIYLDWALQEGSIRAMIEKAELLLNQKIPDIKEACKLLEKSVESGDSYAPYRLGQLYENGESGKEPDYYKAFELYKLSAERGYIHAIELVGHYYRTGLTKAEEADPGKAIEYLYRAIEKGSEYARVELAICYESGFGFEKNLQKAYDLFRTAAENGYVCAYNKVGYYEEDGVIGEKNQEKAFQAFQKAAQGENAEGIYNVARCYQYAIGVSENPKQAIENYKKATAYNYGHAYIKMALAYETKYGGLSFDRYKIMDYMMKAAEQGYSYAQYKVGHYYYYGLIKRDFEKAFAWLYKSYEQGNAYAALLLGDYYLYNERRQRNPEYEKAFQYYKAAEQQGIISEGLGICYEYGIGTRKNPREAVKYYQIGAEAGYTEAKYQLGIAYRDGRGTETNMAEAFRWLSEAAAEGHAHAGYFSAMMLLNGDGIAQNLEQGIAQLMKVAEIGHADAQYELGNCYFLGKGVPEDEVKAMMWYQRSFKNGHSR